MRSSITEAASDMGERILHPREFSLLVPGGAKWLFRAETASGQAHDAFDAAYALPALAADDKAGIREDRIRKLEGVIGPVLEHDAPARSPGYVGR